nr:unnamed protein product [Digitaria exilis]
MEKRKRVLELRDRLDRTLAMPDLAEESLLKALVKKQILASSLTGAAEGDIDLIAETRAKEVSEFLEMLNTSSDGQSSKVHGAPQKEWKISNLDTINVQTHGFSRDGIPEAGDTVRIDVFGGFVLQRITKERSFFRAIANMDIKLDFVPPWLINFMSRQLIGSGHKLYQKAVSTVATCDEDYKRALRGPLYTRIREYQDSDDKEKVTSTEENATERDPTNIFNSQ